MVAINEAQVFSALSAVRDPYIPNADLVSRKCVRDVRVVDGKVFLQLSLGYPAEGLIPLLTGQIREALAGLQGFREVEVSFDWAIEAQPVQGNIPAMRNIKNIVAVASGKGGVGKSTTAVNLALALAKEGARVGLLDADIYGPSQQMMLGIPEGQRPEGIPEQQMLKPIKAHGVQAMSMGFLVTEDTPMVWRGPMVSGALQQLLTQTAWDELDYLIVDMPPGTGDIQLTLSQRVPVSGAVVVTTPQDIALLDAKKGIEMFRKVNVPVLGIVENMALHTCSNCGHVEHLFGAGGGERMAQEYGTELLGSLPLDIKIREQVDAGKPSVVAEPEGVHALIYRDIARRMAATLATRGAAARPMPRIVVSND